MRGARDVRERRGGETDRSRCRRGASGGVREYSSRCCEFDLSVEEKSGIRAGEAADHQDIEEAAGETASCRGAPAFLRCTGIYCVADCGGVASIPRVARGGPRL